MQVDLFIPCFVDQFHPETAKNMVMILEKLGVQLHYNTEQTCCGMAAYNAGHWDQAKEVGEKFITEFKKDRTVVGLSGACVGMVRNDYSSLFHNAVVHNQCKQLQRNLKEFTELLHEKLDIASLNLVNSSKVTWMDACQALRECKIDEAPRAILSKIKGLTFVELGEKEQCCGFGGIFSVRKTDESIEMGIRKLDLAVEKGVDYILSTDTSCLMHLDAIAKRNNYSVKVIHLVDFLAMSMQ